MAEATLSVSGLAQAERALNELAADMRRKVVLAALRDAARPLVLAARQLAPVLKTPRPRRVAGTLKRNIRAITSKKHRGQDGLLGIYISVKASKRDLKNAPITGDPYYWRWLEGGHAIVRRSRRVGTRYGKALNSVTLRARRRAAADNVKPYPFLGPAFASRSDAALRVFERRILERIAKANAAK
jgi:hypothetical protein